MENIPSKHDIISFVMQHVFFSILIYEISLSREGCIFVLDIFARKKQMYEEKYKLTRKFC